MPERTVPLSFSLPDLEARRAWRFTHIWDLRERLKTAGEAREWATKAVLGWGLLGHLDAVELAASELVANVIRHAAWGSSLGADMLGNDLLVELYYSRARQKLRLHVFDPMPTRIPNVNDVRQVAPLEESGRGVFLCQEFSDGIETWAEAYRKCVAVRWDLTHVPGADK